MSEAYDKSVKLYWMAKNTEGPNREFNIESKTLAVHDDYYACLRVLAIYTRTHDTSIIAYAIWGRKKLGLKFTGMNVTVGVVKDGEVRVGVTREIENSFDLQRYLENRMGFTTANLNEQMFEKAYEQLKKIESELQIRIDPNETKKWSIQPYHPRPE